jgi:hypothetical protein
MTFYTPCLLAQCANNAINALYRRHLAAAPNPCRVTRDQLFLFSHVRRTALLYFLILEMDGNDDWEKKQTQAKLVQIREHWDVAFRHYDRAKTFCKREVGWKVPTKARLIQAHVNFASAYDYPREYHAMLGIMKRLNHEPFVYDDVVFEFHYAGGYNHDEMSDLVSAWLDGNDNFYIDERDGQNWDSSMNEVLLDTEACIYEACGFDCAQHVRARNGPVRGTIVCKNGYERVVVRYTTCGKRLSGDWNTTAGNTNISQEIVFFSIRSLPPHLRPNKVYGLFMGDDYWGLYVYNNAKPDPRLLRQALDHFDSQCGITPVRGIFDDPLHTIFISMGLWYRRSDEGRKYQFVPHPARQMSKLFFSARTTIQGGIANQQRSMAYCNWFIYHGFHMMMDFIKVHYTPGPVRRVTNEWWCDYVTYKVRDVDWAESFTHKYGFPYEATKFPMPERIASYRHPVVDEMLRVESLDPPERPACLSR